MSCQSKYIAVVCDSYANENSIKGGERARRAENAMQEIYNPTLQTPLPKQRKKLLSNPLNKANLANLMMTHWAELCSVSDHLPEGHKLYLSGGFKDSHKCVVVQPGEAPQEIPELFSDHEEADSRIFVHVDHGMMTLNQLSLLFVL